MKSRKSHLRAIAKLTDERGPGDGVDPRHVRGGSKRRKKHKKTPQLCKQVEVAIQMALAESADPVLQELMLLRVEGVTSNGNLLVVTTAADDSSDLAEDEALDALDRASAKLRGAVADSISRKRVPNIAYAFVPWPGGGS